MKVLIISLPRTGSTSLLNDISLKRNLKKYDEPFSFEKNHTDYNWLDNDDDYIVKSLIGQPRVSDIIEFYVKYSKKFDEIILLSRRDLLECAKSYAFLQWNLSNGISKHDKYIWESTPNLNEVYNTILNLNSNLKKLSLVLNIDIIYYEDIYDVDSDDRFRSLSKKNNII